MTQHSIHTMHDAMITITSKKKTGDNDGNEISYLKREFIFRAQ